MASAEEDREDRDAAAAEYALGTLEPAERLAFRARLADDLALAAEVSGWERRLAALSEETPPVAAPTRARRNALARIAALSPDNVVKLERRAKRWRNAAAAAMAIAACLAIFIVVRSEWTPAESGGGLYVATLTGSDRAPAFVAAVDVKNRAIVIRRVGAQAPTGHSYELWALGANRSSPQPVGVIDASARIPAGRLGALNRTRLGSTIFAISLEPEGGSPTGKPTGPVLYTGKLLRAE